MIHLRSHLLVYFINLLGSDLLGTSKPCVPYCSDIVIAQNVSGTSLGMIFRTSVRFF